MTTISCNCLLCDATISVVLEGEPKESDYVGNVCKECLESELYEDQQKFGRFLFLLRKQYGWSRKYLSDRLGFSSESSVMNFETGHTVIKPKYLNRFCRITPNKLTVPVLYAMFEASTIEPPCKCYCHHDMKNALKNIYDDEGRCNLCGHDENSCTIWNGLWFEKGSIDFDGDK